MFKDFIFPPDLLYLRITLGLFEWYQMRTAFVICLLVIRANSASYWPMSIGNEWIKQTGSPDGRYYRIKVQRQWLSDSSFYLCTHGISDPYGMNYQSAFTSVPVWYKVISPDSIAVFSATPNGPGERLETISFSDQSSIASFDSAVDKRVDKDVFSSGPISGITQLATAKLAFKSTVSSNSRSYVAYNPIGNPGSNCANPVNKLKRISIFNSEHQSFFILTSEVLNEIWYRYCFGRSNRSIRGSAC